MRVKCNQCAADYDDQWRGTTCSACDGIIGGIAMAGPENNPRDDEPFDKKEYESYLAELEIKPGAIKIWLYDLLVREIRIMSKKVNGASPSSRLVSAKPSVSQMSRTKAGVEITSLRYRSFPQPSTIYVTKLPILFRKVTSIF